jgi:predicted ATPase with chaperone activity
MLARRFAILLPAMRLADALETTRLHRVAGLTGGVPPSSPRARSAPPTTPSPMSA